MNSYLGKQNATLSQILYRELGGINNAALLDELFAEFDVDSDGFIDYEEYVLTFLSINRVITQICVPCKELFA